MTPPFPANRSAEEFARVIDGPARTDVADRYSDLVRTVTLLRTHPQPVPRPEFAADLRTRLMAAADVALLPTSPAPRRVARSLGWRERYIGAAAASLVLVGSATGIAVAAQGALPGDTLYPVKRGIEHVEVKMSTNDSARGQELLNQANTRLAEVRALVANPDNAQSATLIKQTLDSFTASADQGSGLLFTTFQGQGNDHDIAAVRTFTSKNMATLASLASVSPTTATDALANAGATLEDIDQQARVLCIACSDAAPVSLPQTLFSLTSLQSLQSLVTLPTARADKAAELAAAAEKAASTMPTTPPGQSATLPASQTGQPAAQPTPGSTLPTPDPLRIRVSQHPVKDLVDGISSALPGPLGTTASGVTSPLTDTVKGLGQDLSGVLGGLLTPPTDTPTQ